MEQYNVSVFARYKTLYVLYLTKTFVVEVLYYCNLLCYVMLYITTDMYYIDSKCTEMKGFVHICTYIDAVFCTNCKS